MFSVRSALTTLAMGLATLTPFAQSVPATINYQGRLTDNTPSQVPVSTTVNMTFEIWDAPTAGARLWLEPNSGATPVTVTNGIFNVLLGASAGGSSVPIPASVFTAGTTSRYLQIIANGETLTPRQAISATGYANQAQNAATAASATNATFAVNATQLAGVAATSWQRSLSPTGCPAGQFYNAIAQDGTAGCATVQSTLTPPLSLSGTNTQPIISATNAGIGNGVYGENSTTTSGVIGVHGKISSTTPGGNSTGVRGENLGTSNFGIGVWGSQAGSGWGVHGTAPSGRGVYGYASGGSGVNYGVFGSSASSAGYGGYFNNSNSSGVSYGVFGTSASPAGYGGYFNNSNNGTSLYAAAAGTGWGIDAEQSASTGATYAIVGQVQSNAGIGIYGGALNGSVATGTVSIGVKGENFAVSGPGSGYAVYGVNNSTNGSAVFGRSFATDGIGVTGAAQNGSNAVGVYGNSATGDAGYFYGRVYVNGTLQKTAGSFKIDHPLDPENKYLYHSFVESPDMMNIYNGNILLDARGEAQVVMPDWFGALNRDFRYQLTCIGGFAPVYISEELKDNRFKIAGGRPGLKISWTVTGIRKDPYAEKHRIPVEQDKPAAERGFYLHPGDYGQPEEKGIEWGTRPEMMRQMKAEREKAQPGPSTAPAP